MTTDQIKARARALGERMAREGYDSRDNPYAGVHGACARAWHEGYRGMSLVLAVSRSRRYAPLGT